MREWSSEDPTILVADYDRRFRAEVADAFYRAGWNVVEAASGSEALGAGSNEEVVLAIVEVRLLDLSGYEVCRRLRERRGQGFPIVFVSHDRTDVADRVAGLLVGADDYVVKPVAIEELVARVRRHLERARAADASADAGLTDREREVLEALARGLAPGQIAVEFEISPKTVATHVERIYAKLGVHTRTQAVVTAVRLGIIELETRVPAGAPT